MVGIGFFAPLPLAMMMPFMAGQSMIMGDAFGKAYQYGKRKISSMTNEEFNKLTPAMLATQLQTDYLSMIPSLKASVAASHDFQSFIIIELGKIIKELPSDVINAFGGNETGQKAFADIAPQNYQPPQKHELLIKIEQAFSGFGTLTPPAYGSHDDDTLETKLTQEDYGITENFGKQSDVPITLTLLSDAQIKDAYSDSLSNRLGLSAKNKQLLTLEYKKRFGGGLKQNRQAEQNAVNILGQKPATPLTTAHASWQKINTDFQANILKAKDAWNRTPSQIITKKPRPAGWAAPPPAQVSVNPAKALAKRAYENQKEAYKNWITFHRNNSNHLIKIEARQLYNERRWTRF